VSRNAGLDRATSTQAFREGKIKAAAVQNRPVNSCFPTSRVGRLSQ